MQTGNLIGNHLNMLISTDSLSDWFHILHVQMIDSIGTPSPIISRTFAIVPQAASGNRDLTGQLYRYWFDREESNMKTGTLVSNTFQMELPTDGLTDWFHVLHLQTQDDAGNWSPIINRTFAIVPQAASGNRDLTGQPYQYWIDESGTMAEGTMVGNVLSMDIPVDELEEGEHVFYLQVKDDAGNWSAPVASEFNVYTYGLTLLASGEGHIQRDSVVVRDSVANLNIPTGSTVTLSFIPDAGYIVKNILLNESEDITASLSADSTLTITIDSLTTISTTFDLTDFLKLGDVNNDNLIDVADIAMTVSHLIGGHPQPFVLRQADANNDGDVDVADLTRIVDVITGAVERGKHDAKQRFTNEGTETSASVTGSLSGDVISFSNSAPTAFSAFQMTVTLPEGVEPTDISINPSYRANHQLATGRTEDGGIAIIAYSPDNRPLLGGEGPLLQIRTDKTIEGEVSMENIVFASGGKAHRFAPMRLSQADGLIDVTANTVTHSYDISGRRANSIRMPRGVVIIGGRKIVFK